MTDLAGHAFSTPRMRRIFSGTTQVQRMLDFEAALARAQATVGLIPTEAAHTISNACRAEELDPDAVLAEGADAGTPLIPLVRALARACGDAGRYVHHGATTQDVIDTGLMLQARDGLDAITTDLLGAAGTCATLATRHRDDVMVARTLLQHANPITFGLKAAQWLAALDDGVRRLRRVRDEEIALQFGGAAGTLASLGDHGDTVAGLLAEELGLPSAPLPWHTRRDRVAAVVAALGITAGALAKIATDVVLLAQPEVAEVSVQGRVGGSSALPHKQNPTDAVMAAAAARLASAQVGVVIAAMSHEHERAAGSWQAEWAVVPAVFHHTAAAASRVRSLLESLEVDTVRMRANLEVTGDVVMAESLAAALAARIGPQPARELVKTLAVRAARHGAGLRAEAEADDRVSRHLSAGDLDRAFDPAAYLGSVFPFIDRALAAHADLADSG